jgi:hypothetical protein
MIQYARAAARAAGVLNDDGVSDRSTTSFVASTDGGSGSTPDSISEFVDAEAVPVWECASHGPR